MHDILCKKIVILCHQKECDDMSIADNREIGAYISRLVDSKFDSARKFCIEYLKEEKANGEEPSDGEIQNMANRYSQIKNGNKSIQISDLPIFSKLLDVSFEQILSTGKCGVPKNSRMTNYTVAQSHSKKEWMRYIEIDKKPILNPDEYGKTVLEYAIEFGNYDFLKFLIDEGYIWFDSHDYKDYAITFGAGTNISRVKFVERNNGVFCYYNPKLDAFQNELAEEDWLRMYIISLAVDHNDLKTLEKLRAREIPELYFNTNYVGMKLDIYAHYNESMVSHIAKSSRKVLNYFTDTFETWNKYGIRHEHTFMFPYISNLLDMLIENNSPFLKKALEKVIAHNEKTLEKLKSLIKQIIENGCYNGDGWKEEFDFYENGNIVSFRDTFSYKGIITNIAHTTKKSKDGQINKLIEKLNESYESVRNIKTEGLE